MALIDDTVSILNDLISMPTVSAESNLELITYASERLGDCGATISVMRDETGRKANLFATIGPEGDGGIVLSGHTDVVPALEEEWTSDPFRMRADKDRLFGRGACDMKGFIAAVLATAPLYARRSLKRPLHVALTYDEEVGCHGARQLVDDLRRSGLKPSVAIVGEPTEMRVIEGHKGCNEYTTSFTGLEGHGSHPDAGVNAIEFAARFVHRLMEHGGKLRSAYPSDSRFDPPWSTVQVGRIEGGAARNIVAGHCVVEWELRPVSAEDAAAVKADLVQYCEDELLPIMRATFPGAAIETVVVGEVDGLHPVEQSEARRIVSDLLGDNGAGMVSFGTEAGLYQQLGLSAVVCGPGSIVQAHKPDEYVTLDQLQRCLDVLSGLERELVASDVGR